MAAYDLVQFRAVRAALPPLISTPERRNSTSHPSTPPMALAKRRSMSVGSPDSRFICKVCLDQEVSASHSMREKKRGSTLIGCNGLILLDSPPSSRWRWWCCPAATCACASSARCPWRGGTGRQGRAISGTAGSSLFSRLVLSAGDRSWRLRRSSSSRGKVLSPENNVSL